MSSEQKRVIAAGVDEVGRGPLAGPVVAAAVILSSPLVPAGLDDSKKLSEKRRDTLDAEIRDLCIAHSIGMASREEIDSLNILNATYLAMQRAVSALSVRPTVIWVDGNQAPEFAWNEGLIPSETYVGGDGRIAEISAASIIAKVYRDRLMRELERQYPGYGFASHKGYGTKSHRAALEALGPTPEHRRSFAPLRTMIEVDAA